MSWKRKEQDRGAKLPHRLERAWDLEEEQVKERNRNLAWAEEPQLELRRAS